MWTFLSIMHNGQSDVGKSLVSAQGYISKHFQLLGTLFVDTPTDSTIGTVKRLSFVKSLGRPICLGMDQIYGFAISRLLHAICHSAHAVCYTSYAQLVDVRAIQRRYARVRTVSVCPSSAGFPSILSILEALLNAFLYHPNDWGIASTLEAIFADQDSVDDYVNSVVGGLLTCQRPRECAILCMGWSSYSSLGGGTEMDGKSRGGSVLSRVTKMPCISGVSLSFKSLSDTLRSHAQTRTAHKFALNLVCNQEAMDVEVQCLMPESTKAPSKRKCQWEGFATIVRAWYFKHVPLMPK